MTPLEQERRNRFISNLIKEAILNVLVEQQPQQQQQPPPQAASSVPQNVAPASTETNHGETSADVSLTGPEPTEFTVDTMVDKLNVVRGGKSFSDPEVYGKLTTFFNGLSDEQKTSLDYMLTELNKVVTETNQPQQNQQQQPADNSSANQPTPPAAPQGAQQQAQGNMTAPLNPAA